MPTPTTSVAWPPPPEDFTPWHGTPGVTSRSQDADRPGEPRVPRHRNRWPLIVSGVGVLAVVVIVATVIALTSRGSGPAPDAARPAAETVSAPSTAPTVGDSATDETGTDPAITDAPVESSSPQLPVTSSGIDLTAIATSPALQALSDMFDTYFSGVNAHDAATATSVFAPGGSIDPNDPDQVSSFGDGISTTTDDRIRVVAAAPARFGERAGYLVQLTFRSRQAPAYGPGGHQACTLWRLDYQAVGNADRVRLLRSVHAVHHGC